MGRNLCRHGHCGPGVRIPRSDSRRRGTAPVDVVIEWIQSAQPVSSTEAAFNAIVTNTSDDWSIENVRVRYATITESGDPTGEFTLNLDPQDSETGSDRGVPERRVIPRVDRWPRSSTLVRLGPAFRLTAWRPSTTPVRALSLHPRVTR